jgi:hypothetical protein
LALLLINTDSTDLIADIADIAASQRHRPHREKTSTQESALSLSIACNTEPFLVGGSVQGAVSQGISG